MNSPPKALTDLVRDALLRLYDPAGLQRHPLLELAGPSVMANARVPGQHLRQSLMDAIEELHPKDGVTRNGRVWRTYRILELRYIEGHDVAQVSEYVALSRSQYHREHNHALQAVAAVLWERWHLAERWPHGAAEPAARAEPDDPALREAVRLRSEGSLGSINVIDVLRSVRCTLQPLCTQRGVDLHIMPPRHQASIMGERVALRQALLTILAPVISTMTNTRLAIALVDHAGGVEIRISSAAAITEEAVCRSIEESRPFVEALAGTATYSMPSATAGQWVVSLGLWISSHPALLVVDNNPDFIRLVERYLVDQPWDILSAGDIEQAVVLAQHHHPQAILLDVVFPDRDGWDLILELKAASGMRDIPVIICSVLNQPEMAHSLGASAYLQKPVTQGELVSVLTAFR